MPTYSGRWIGRVEVEFEVQAESESEAWKVAEQQMELENVTELLDTHVEFLDEDE